MWVKVCGIGKLEDAMAAEKAGAEAVGLVFANSPRQVTVPQAQQLAKVIPKSLLRVGVFVDQKPDLVAQIAEAVGLDLIQLHGRESPAYCRLFRKSPWGLIKAWRIGAAEPEGVVDYQGLVGALLVDSGAGSGKTFPWEQLGELPWEGRLILAGGLTRENVAGAIATVVPWGVDATSSLESAPGKKDPAKIIAFVQEAKRVGRVLDVSTMA